MDVRHKKALIILVLLLTLGVAGTALGAANVELTSALPWSSGSQAVWDNTNLTLTLNNFTSVVMADEYFSVPGGSTIILEGNNSLTVGSVGILGRDAGTYTFGGTGRLQVSASSGFYFNGSGDVTLTCIDSPTISIVGMSNPAVPSEVINIDGVNTLTLNGTGNLTLQTDAGTGAHCAVSLGSGNLSVEGVTLNAMVGSSNSSSVRAILVPNGTVTIQDALVKAVAGAAASGAPSIGIMANGISIHNSEVTASANASNMFSYGLYASNGDVTIDGRRTVTVNSDEASSSHGGIVASGNIRIAAPLAITSPKGAKVSDNGKLIVDAQGRSVANVVISYTAPATPVVPETGDNSEPTRYIAIALLSMFGIAWGIMKKKKASV